MSLDDDPKPMFPAMEKSTSEIFEKGRRAGALEALDEVLVYLRRMHRIVRDYSTDTSDRVWPSEQQISLHNAIKEVEVVRFRFAVRHKMFDFGAKDDE